MGAQRTWTTHTDGTQGAEWAFTREDYVPAIATQNRPVNTWMSQDMGMLLVDAPCGYAIAMGSSPGVLEARAVPARCNAMPMIRGEMIPRPIRDG
jgi:hypothetical protein